MDWIKVTPETMPPDMEPVMVVDWQIIDTDCFPGYTGDEFEGLKPFVVGPYRYNKAKNIWEYRLSGMPGVWDSKDVEGRWKEIRNKSYGICEVEIMHWASMPPLPKELTT